MGFCSSRHSAILVTRLWLFCFFVYRFQSVVDWPYCCILLLATINKHTEYTSSVMFVVRVGFGHCCLSVFFSGGSWVFHLVLDMRLFTGLHIAMCWPQICCVAAKCGSGKEWGEGGGPRLTVSRELCYSKKGDTVVSK